MTSPCSTPPSPPHTNPPLPPRFPTKLPLTPCENPAARMPPANLPTRTPGPPALPTDPKVQLPINLLRGTPGRLPLVSPVTPPPPGSHHKSLPKKQWDCPGRACWAIRSPMALPLRPEEAAQRTDCP